VFRRDTESESCFRGEVRAWLAENLPPGLMHRIQRPSRAELLPWHRLVHARGWIAPHWPREFGGMGASLNEQLILIEEMVEAGAPSLVSIGLNFVGPLIVQYGSDEQRALHLPKILSGEVQWAQGYSEPNAGSDLASVTTAAEPAADGFTVTGQKIWQSHGHESDWMFALVRTDRQAAKHQGISALLMDLRSPGITIRPIRNIARDDELSEVFMEKVWVPRTNLVGRENEGWRVANALLAHERLTGGSPLLSLASLQRLRALASASEDPHQRRALARAEIEFLAFEAAFTAVVEAQNRGRKPGAESSALKLMQTGLQQHLNDLLLDAAGAAAAQWAPIATPQRAVAAAESFLVSRRVTIFGDTREIQKNIVAKRVLDLPD